ncbi:response regulator [Pseudoflavitalea sp. X16]|uniref:ATP-binding protein n=1 Tax=Paraflavitalea devenefica TaxID=2716334 RepID=UPI0014230735|nr:ATP-binding protein [Paraflavitalea devenefica]NII25447.1 response regulator [Paraflavitalea devenefica]
MTSKKIIYYILAAFIAGNLLLIYLQYNSAKSINGLITGNERLMNEFKVDNELRALEKGVQAIENGVLHTITTKDTVDIEGIERQVTEVERDLGMLQKINDDDSSVKFIDELDTLVHQKLILSHQVLDTFHHRGKASAARLFATTQNRQLTLDISTTARKIDSSRQQLLATLTDEVDRNGREARTAGMVLIMLVLVSGAVLFWFIINRIGQQNQLIHRLDASEKKVREAARIKENFMANMSHEIRTPMNAILGFTSLLQKHEMDTVSKGYVQAIQRSGDNLLTIINDILDLSKIEAGMMRIEPTPFSVRELFYSVETMFLEKIKEKGLQLITTVEDTVPDTLNGDATRLTQVLVNLIGNAAKFTQQGAITVIVNNEGIKEKTILLAITVSDTGIGIESDKLSDIFERFRQAEDSITRKYGGTGLGLSIVKDLVELQGGTIQVMSEPDKGSTFRLTIPYKITNEAINSQTRWNSPALKNTVPDHIRILVVEDNEINQQLMKHLLSYWKLSFDLAGNGKEAITKLQDQHYDLILMDIQMPGMDGYTATAQIRHTLHLNTPVIAMTAHALAGEREKCLSAGMNEYISKPIQEEELYRLISKLTGHQQLAVPLQKPVYQPTPGNYRHIDLGYMQEVSNGNKEYEKTVTEQFLEMIPEDLKSLELAWRRKDFIMIRVLAHNMKTSVSVMGLTEKLQPYLDMLEQIDTDEEALWNNITAVQHICIPALKEARHFYTTL